MDELQDRETMTGVRYDTKVSKTNKQKKNGNAIKCNRGLHTQQISWEYWEYRLDMLSLRHLVRYKARYEDKCSVGYSTEEFRKEI